MAAVMEMGMDPLPMLAGAPLVGAVLGLLVWGRLRALKVWVLLIAFASLLMLVGMSGRPTQSATGKLLVYLLPLTAFLSLLGQPLRRENRAAWLMTLVLLGLGLGASVGGDRTRPILLALLLGLVGVLLWRYRAMSGSVSWWGIGTYGLGTVCALAALITAPPTSGILSLLASATLLPLVPAHGGYVAALMGLPGNLSAFLALVLPSIGFHSLLTLLPSLPVALVEMLVILALVSALYGSLKALIQPRVRPLLGYASLAFFAILWWYVAATRTTTPQTAIYLGAVGLVTSGLLLAWHVVEARYGDVDLGAMSGLAYPMPRFAILVSLLAVAAMGLPPFGVFSGFMGMFLDPSLTLSGAFPVIVVAWLAASWYFLNMIQRLLFGRHRPDLRSGDARPAELTSLLILVLILMILGIAPARFFEVETPAHGYGTAMEPSLWNK